MFGTLTCIPPNIFNKFNAEDETSSTYFDPLVMSFNMDSTKQNNAAKALMASIKSKSLESQTSHNSQAAPDKVASNGEVIARGSDGAGKDGKSKLTIPVIP
jgi:hypothetical protein